MAMGRARLFDRGARLLQGLPFRSERRRSQQSAITEVGVRIREAEPRDCAIVAEMANDLARFTGVGDGGMTAHRVERDLIGGEGLTLIVGEMQGMACGYALYTIAYDTAHGVRGLYLSDLFVDGPARRLGVGQSLMSELAWRCRQDGGAFLWWIVMPGNPEAEAFYTSLGAASDPPKAMAVHGGAFDALIQRRRDY